MLELVLAIISGFQVSQISELSPTTMRLLAFRRQLITAMFEKQFIINN